MKRRISSLLQIFKARYLNFLLPNFRKLRSGTIKYSKVWCNQKTIITGNGNVEIGEGCSFGYYFGGHFRNGCVEIQARTKNSLIKLGKNISTNNNVFFCAANYIEVGEGTLIGQGVTFMDFEAHGVHPAQRLALGEIGKIVIGENVWIGNNVTVLKNAEIGNNTIVAANAVVTGKFPANVIIGGIPAKVIKHINY